MVGYREKPTVRLQMTFLFQSDRSGLVLQERPDRALNCEDWQVLRIQQLAVTVQRGVALCPAEQLSQGSPPLALPLALPLIDPVMNRTSGGFRDGQVAHLLKLGRLSCDPLPNTSDKAWLLRFIYFLVAGKHRCLWLKSPPPPLNHPALCTEKH